MQGWDSVVVRADVELGGTDQRFNLLVGRDMQRGEGMEPQVIVINPLLPGTDGEKKMSKSAGNYIGITEEPREQFGKAMAVGDHLLRDWLTCFTDVADERIDELCDTDRTHPRDAKEAMAKAIVERYWGAEAADAAAAEFRRVFSDKQLPSEMPEIVIPDEGVGLLALLADNGLAKSRSEARRLVDQGAVRIDGDKLDDAEATVTPPDGAILKVGKRRFARLRRV